MATFADALAQKDFKQADVMQTMNDGIKTGIQLATAQEQIQEQKQQVALQKEQLLQVQWNKINGFVNTLSRTNSQTAKRMLPQMYAQLDASGIAYDKGILEDAASNEDAKKANLAAYTAILAGDPINPGEGLMAAQSLGDWDTARNAIVNNTKLRSQQEIASARLQAQGAQIDAKQARLDSAAENKKFAAAKLSDKQATQFAEFDTALEAISSIRSKKQSQNTGKFSNFQNWAAQLVGMDDAEKSAFKAQVGDQLAEYIKSISGGAVSDEERKSLIENIPTTSDSDKTFTSKLETLNRRIETRRKVFLETLKKQGKDVSSFERKETTVNAPNAGDGGSVDPRVQKAIDAGYTPEEIEAFKKSKGIK